MLVYAFEPLLLTRFGDDLCDVWPVVDKIAGHGAADQHRIFVGNRPLALVLAVIAMFAEYRPGLFAGHRLHPLQNGVGDERAPLDRSLSLIQMGIGAHLLRTHHERQGQRFLSGCVAGGHRSVILPNHFSARDTRPCRAPGWMVNSLLGEVTAEALAGVSSDPAQRLYSPWLHQCYRSLAAELRGARCQRRDGTVPPNIRRAGGWNLLGRPHRRKSVPHSKGGTPSTAPATTARRLIPFQKG